MLGESGRPSGRPDAWARSRQVALVAARRPITGEQTILPAIGHSTGPGGTLWLEVMLPGRPDGSTGWMAAQGTRRLVTGWHIMVDLARRRVSAYLHGRVVRAFRRWWESPRHPPPAGGSSLRGRCRWPPVIPVGRSRLALSARSNALQEFEGGAGQIALNGRNNLGGTLGTAASHGCVRLSTASIDWLAARIGSGTPTDLRGLSSSSAFPLNHECALFAPIVAEADRS
jgi:hypothetical protein